MTPMVSIITAFLNEKRFLAEAIESVIHQQYTNWELILVDDGSTDGSAKIARDYVSRYREKMIYAEHSSRITRGLSASRNLGISLANGELIALLDADDVWTPQKIEAQVALMNAYNRVAMICEASEYWYSWLDKSKQDVVIQVGKTQDLVFDPPMLIKVIYPLSDGAAPCPSGIMVRRSTIEKHKGFEEQFTGKYQLYEDQAFLHKIYLNESVYISSLCHNKYRQREGSLVRQITKEGNYHTVRKYFLQWLKQYIAQNNITDPEVHHLLKKTLNQYRDPINRLWKYLFSSHFNHFK